MDAKAFLRQRWTENSVMKKLAGPNADWGKHVAYNSPHNPPSLPPTAQDSKMVWNPKLQKYVLGVKGYNYVPDLKNWLNKQKADKIKREESARRYMELSPTNSDKRKFQRRTRKTRYFNEATRTYRSRSRSPSRRTRSRSRRH